MATEIDLITLSEASKLLRVKVATLRAWRAQRRLPFLKLGGKILLRRGDIEKFIESNMVPARKEAA